MSFKLSIIIGVLIAATALAEAGDPPESFVAAQFTNPPAPALLALTGETAGEVEQILGRPYTQAQVRYWQAEGKTVWILEGRGKSQLITAGFVVEKGRMVKSEVLTYRESRGREILAPRFLQQFSGAGLRDGLELDRRIDSITGATISVNAMKNLARLALFLDARAPN